MSLLATLLSPALADTGRNMASGQANSERSPTEGLLVDRAMSLVAEAEQMLADQRARIAYLEGLTMTDELTGLFNRRGFFEHFRRELAAARRSADAVGALLLCDLDGFKAVNDSLGHLAGDAVLRHVAETLRGTVRSTDYVARLGGDEFAVLLTMTDRVAAETRAAQIDSILNGTCLLWQDNPIAVGASVGMHPYDGSSREDDVFAAADRELYAIKNQRGARR